MESCDDSLPGFLYFRRTEIIDDKIDQRGTNQPPDAWVDITGDAEFLRESRPIPEYAAQVG